jgi:long-chain acyl-CoA synthetase
MSRRVASQGVMLTHASLLADASATLTASIRYTEGREVYLSYLPLAHVLERVLHIALLGGGSAIGFWGGVRCFAFYLYLC